MEFTIRGCEIHTEAKPLGYTKKFGIRIFNWTVIFMGDNKTSQPAQYYDGNIEKTIPRYSLFHDETLSIVETVNPKPRTWLDTGCGTGTFVSKTINNFNNLHIVLADPSEAMLSIAKGKLSGKEQSNLSYIKAGTEDLNYTEGSFDVITAILAHHYLDVNTRKEATKNCFKMLKEGGIYVTFESIKANTELGIKIGLERWRESQLSKGKSLEAVERHIARYGLEFFPITINSHIDLLNQVGFSIVEVLWISGMQAGFYAIK